MKCLQVILISLSLSACGSSGSSSENDDNGVKTLKFSGISTTPTIHDAGIVDVVINGTSNTVTVTGDTEIKILTISGTSNTADVRGAKSIEHISMTGINGRAQIYDDMPHSSSDSGTNNFIDTYPRPTP